MYDIQLLFKTASKETTFGNTHAICALSFGRNTFPDKHLGRDLKACFRRYGLRRSIISIPRFFALKKSGFDPGKANRAIAWRVRQYAEEMRVVLGQWEVMFALWEKDPMWYDERDEHFFVIWPDENQARLDTDQALRNMFRDRPKHENFLLIAHQELWPCCIQTAEQMLEPDSVHIAQIGKIPYEPRSIQKWARTPQSFAAYEKKQQIIKKFPVFFRRLLYRFCD